MQVIIFKLILSSVLVTHPFHVSVCDIEYNPQTKSLEIIHKIFLDDLETTLNERYSLKMDLMNNPKAETLNPILKKYISKNFRIISNGQDVPMIHLGSDIQEDVLRYYIEVKDFDVSQEIQVTDRILLETFPDQQNLVHCRYGEKVISFLFSRSEPGKQSIRFEN